MSKGRWIMIVGLLWTALCTYLFEWVYQPYAHPDLFTDEHIVSLAGLYTGTAMGFLSYILLLLFIALWDSLE